MSFHPFPKSTAEKENIFIQWDTLTFYHLFSLQARTTGLESFILHGGKYQPDFFNILREVVYIEFLTNLY